MSTPRIAYRDIVKRFAASDRRRPEEAVTAVRDVSLTIADGEIVSLIGPSGCGKSTLLNMGAGLYGPTEGEVFVDGERVEGPNDHVAFMLQKDLLLPWRTIRDNVELGQEIKGTAGTAGREKALALLERCHLSQFAEHFPHQLSGGMRQRAALARTLAVDPSVLLMDEPFSALDAQTKMVLQQDLATTLQSENKTALFITHDLAEAVALSHRVLVMSARPGTIIREIPIDLPHMFNPMRRRQAPEMGDYVSELMGLLHIGEETEAAA